MKCKKDSIDLLSFINFKKNTNQIYPYRYFKYLAFKAKLVKITRNVNLRELIFNGLVSLAKTKND